jgi:ABC-2 type transport system permease protein
MLLQIEELTKVYRTSSRAREAGFSPLTFLPEKLPAWLAVIHRILPIQAMGEVTRGTIAPNEFGLPLGAFVTLAIWCLLGFGVTYAATARRG